MPCILMHRPALTPACHMEHANEEADTGGRVQPGCEEPAMDLEWGGRKTVRAD